MNRRRSWSAGLTGVRPAGTAGSRAKSRSKKSAGGSDFPTPASRSRSCVAAHRPARRRGAARPSTRSPTCPGASPRRPDRLVSNRRGVSRPLRRPRRAARDRQRAPTGDLAEYWDKELEQRHLDPIFLAPRRPEPGSAGRPLSQWPACPSISGPTPGRTPPARSAPAVSRHPTHPARQSPRMPVHLRRPRSRQMRQQPRRPPAVYPLVITRTTELTPRPGHLVGLAARPAQPRSLHRSDAANPPGSRPRPRSTRPPPHPSLLDGWARPTWLRRVVRVPRR
jgi:hypothetical protein